MFNLQGQQQIQQHLNNLVLANPNIQIRPVFTFSPNQTQLRQTNSFNGYDSTPRKRKLVSDSNEADQANNSGKRQHIEAQHNSHQHGISSCFNGNCQQKTNASESFSRLLNFFQNDQRNVLKGFCMNCGSSIFEELFHLYEHFRGFSQSFEQQNVQKSTTTVQPETTSVQSKDDPKVIVKLEPENILEQTDIIDHFDKTNVSDMELDESITGREVHENAPKEVTVPESTPMPPPTNQNTEKAAETSHQIKKEAIERNLDLEETVRMPEPTELKAVRKIEDLNATVMIPYDQHKLTEDNESENSDDLISVPTQKTTSVVIISDSESSTEDPMETMCMDSIIKKIADERKILNDKLENMNTISEDSNEESQNKKPENMDLTFNNMTIDNLLEKIKNSSKSKKEGTKFVIEVEDLSNDKDRESVPEQSSKNDEKTKPKSKPKTSIDNYFSKGSKSSNSKELDVNLNDQLMTKIRSEKTPSKRGKKSNKENEEKSKVRRESLRNRNEVEKQTQNKESESNNIAAVNLEQVHPKYQSKSSPNENKSSKNPNKLSKSEKIDSLDTKKSENLNSSTSSHDKSLNTSQKTLNASALELSKHVPYTVDIEALIAKSSSNAELVSIKDLYPWINQGTTSIMFKTKASLDILLNQYSLFSTYKCMNEFCHFFTTDFEAFKTHARSHDSINNYCSYCLKNFDKSIDLCNHLDISHKFDRFQCNKCMFRSCQKGYVDVHQRVHHANEENCEVFKSPVQKLLKSDRSKCLPALNKNREKFVMPYRCKTPRCREVFYCKDNYRQHLEMESQKPTCKDFVALICHQLSLIDHSRTTTNTEGVYQCLHCSYGTDSSNIFDHMALNHPHEFAYVCKRVKPQKLIELNIISAHETVENSTSIEYFGTTTAEAKSFEGNLENLNSNNLEKELKGKKGRMGLVVSEVVSIDN